MPVRISKWACAFRCGRSSMKKESIEKHEPTCFRNPARRACKTCKNEYFTGHLDRPGRGSRECDKGLDLGEQDIRWDCESWEAK